MKCKVDQIRDAWAAGDQIGAMRVAARFFDRSNDTLTFKRGMSAYNNPGFYHHPAKVEDLVDFVVARVLDQLRVPHQLIARWGELPSSRGE